MTHLLKSSFFINLLILGCALRTFIHFDASLYPNKKFKSGISLDTGKKEVILLLLKNIKSDLFKKI